MWGFPKTRGLPFQVPIRGTNIVFGGPILRFPYFGKLTCEACTTMQRTLHS